MKKNNVVLILSALLASCSPSQNSVILTPGSLPPVFVEGNLSFDLNGGYFASGKPLILRDGNSISSISAPTKTYVQDSKIVPSFDGWFTKKADLSSKVSFPITLESGDTLLLYAHYSFYLLNYCYSENAPIIHEEEVTLGEKGTDYLPTIYTQLTGGKFVSWQYKDEEGKYVDFSYDDPIYHDYDLFPRFETTGDNPIPGTSGVTPTLPA